MPFQQVLLVLIAYTIFPLSVFAQNQLNAVYAGIELRQTINGTQTFYPTYYFKTDGTFSSKLSEIDWNTRVDGSYQINNNKIFMQFSAFDGKNTLAIVSDGVLRKNATLLYKYEIVNHIPAITFKQETDYGQIQKLTFDGKGKFKTLGFRNASARDEISEFDGEGRYTIKNSQLIMTYDDGRTLEKSFFYGGGKYMAALINGSTYNVIEDSSLIPKK